MLAASRLPALWLTAAEQVDLRALASGAYGPLVGFLGGQGARLGDRVDAAADGVL